MLVCKMCHHLLCYRLMTHGSLFLQHWVTWPLEHGCQATRYTLLYRGVARGKCMWKQVRWSDKIGLWPIAYMSTQREVLEGQTGSHRAKRDNFGRGVRGSSPENLHCKCNEVKIRIKCKFFFFFFKLSNRCGSTCVRAYGTLRPCYTIAGFTLAWIITIWFKPLLLKHFGFGQVHTYSTT